MCHSSPSEREQLIQVMIDALKQLSDAELQGHVLMQNLLLGLPANRRAMHLKAFRPELSDTTVAKLVGVNRSTLHRSNEYQRFKALLSEPSEPLHGTADSEGNIEAWE